VFAAVPTILRLKIFRPDRFSASQLAFITNLTALVVGYLAVHLLAIDRHAVIPILNFLLLFWYEHPDIQKYEYKYGSY
jgi:hypothetical protein